MRPLDRPRIALVEDDPIMGESLVQRLEIEGFDVSWWQTGKEALAGLEGMRPDLLVSDIRLPDMNGEEVFRRAMPNLGTMPVMFITAFADVDQAVQLIRSGAEDYITKPFNMDTFLGRVEDLVKRRTIAIGNIPGTLGSSSVMRDVENTLRRVADIDSSVLLTGESGVGKEVAARFLHNISNRSDLPFVAVNCAAIPVNLLESELFGHEAGAFTDARKRHQGHCERAGDGILFLDEISELSFELQAKLLRLLQELTFMRVGGNEVLEFSARVVATTNVDLLHRIEEGKFREDLYYRINVIHVEVPPLRERPEDILPLLMHFVATYAEAFGYPVRGVTSLAEQAVLEHEWPGNVRELRNRTERAVALCDGVWVNGHDLFPEFSCSDVSAANGDVATLSEIRDEAERRHIIKALRATDGHVSHAAEILGISRTTLWEKMRKLGLEHNISKK